VFFTTLHTQASPLHVSSTKPFSLCYEKEVRGWLCRSSGNVVTLFQISSLFGEVYLTATNVFIAVSVFRRTAIWPIDTNVFSSADFLLPATKGITRTRKPQRHNVRSKHQHSFTGNWHGSYINWCTFDISFRSSELSKYHSDPKLWSLQPRLTKISRCRRTSEIQGE
jgi:hypothetical protein